VTRLAWATIAVLSASASALAFGAGASRAAPIADDEYAPPSWPATYKSHGPAVLFDEAHHNFHTAEAGYMPFVRLITHDGYTVRVNKAPIDADALRGARIFVAVNAFGMAEADAQELSQLAAPAFAPVECAAMERWVTEGGSLLLVADHYPASGGSAALAAVFGVEMQNGWVSDSTTHTREADGEVFSRANGLLRGSVITNGRNSSERVSTIATYTGQVLRADPKTALFVLGPNAVEESAPDRKSTRSVAGAAQGVAFRHGRGRVVILGEAAMLTSQRSGVAPEGVRWGGLAHPELDNARFTLNVMHWLSGVLN